MLSRNSKLSSIVIEFQPKKTKNILMLGILLAVGASASPLDYICKIDKNLQILLKPPKKIKSKLKDVNTVNTVQFYI